MSWNKKSDKFFLRVKKFVELIFWAVYESSLHFQRRGDQIDTVYEKKTQFFFFVNFQSDTKV